MSRVSQDCSVKGEFPGEVMKAQKVDPLHDQQWRKAQTISTERGDIIGGNGWENDKLKNLTGLLGIDCFDHDSYRMIESDNKEILSILNGSRNLLPKSKEPFLQELYFSTASHYCGLFEAVNKAASIAVEQYNKKEEKSLMDYKVLKANYLWSFICHFFFITLEAVDATTTTKKIFQTSVFFPRGIGFKDVWSFKQVNEFHLNDVVDEEEENDDGWETESYNGDEGTWPFNVFGNCWEIDPKDMEEPNLTAIILSSFDMSYLNRLAGYTLDVYHKKRGRKLELVEICRANYSIRRCASSYYFILKASDADLVVRYFCTNLLISISEDIPNRVRYFKPEPQGENLLAGCPKGY